MAFLTKGDILEAQDIEQEVVAVPEWGGDVLVRGLSGAARDKYESGILTKDKKGRVKGTDLADMRAKMVALSVVDEKSGQLLFSARDVQALSGKSASALNRVFEVAQRLSGLTDDDMDELAKNSDGDQSGDSILD